MRIAHLGPASPIIGDLEASGDDVAVIEDPITTTLDADLLVSYGYRHIVPAAVLTECRAINLHISILPWNRGADPNLWSLIDGTPRGVTIHVMTERLDAGPIIAQRQVDFDEDRDTLASSYVKLKDAIEQLFSEHWPAIRAGTAPTYPQPFGGSYHRVSDRAAVEHLLTDGWDTPIRQLIPAS